MAESVADLQARLANHASGAAGVLSAAQGRYLPTARKLLVDYQRTSGVKQKQILGRMMHAFMQELCGYPPTSYIVTNAVYSKIATDNCPHVIPTSYYPGLTLFYFTASVDPDDVQDLWVKHAQVYLVAPGKEDFTAECATKVIFSKFFVIDGASKEPRTGAWNLWAASDLQAAPIARVDLRHLENDTALASTTSHAVQKRLQTMQYQIATDVQEPNVSGSEALAALMPKMSMEGHSL